MNLWIWNLLVDLSNRKSKRATYNNCKGIVNPIQNVMFTFWKCLVNDEALRHTLHKRPRGTFTATSSPDLNTHTHFLFCFSRMSFAYIDLMFWNLSEVMFHTSLCQSNDWVVISFGIQTILPHSKIASFILHRTLRRRSTFVCSLLSCFSSSTPPQTDHRSTKQRL